MWCLTLWSRSSSVSQNGHWWWETNLFCFSHTDCSWMQVFSAWQRGINAQWCLVSKSIINTCMEDDSSWRPITNRSHTSSASQRQPGIWKNPEMGTNTRCIQLHNSVSKRRRELQCGCTEQIASGKAHKRPTQASWNDSFDGIYLDTSPEVIVSDNAANFTSDAWVRAVFEKNGVKHVRTPPYHPSSNGLAERAVQTFKEGMRKMTDGSLAGDQVVTFSL